MIPYQCCDERRRAAIAGRTDLNGISYLDVVDTAGSPIGPILTTLVLHFINPVTAASFNGITPANISITGGAAITGIGVTQVMPQPPIPGLFDDFTLVINTDKAGDFSVYQLVLAAISGGPPPGFDPVLNAVDFSFRIGCESDFDITLPAACPPTPPVIPPIDYLSRDFYSLRQLMLDRIAVLSTPLAATDYVDLGVTLVELLAYVGDQLSYRQDAVATEATLMTARQRISARRHGRLVDYVMHNGCSARTWVVAAVQDGAAVSLPAGTQLLTSVPALLAGGPAVLVAPGSPLYETALAQGANVFETMTAAALVSGRNEFSFYGWGAEGCCLPKGATSATLLGDQSGLLGPGSVLIFQELLDPVTGIAAQADPAHRCAVRLSGAAAVTDPLVTLFVPAAGSDIVTNITWEAGDALPFALTISAFVQGQAGADAQSGVFVDGISMAFGNVLLAEHGMTLPAPESLGTMPAATLQQIAANPPADSLTEAAIDIGCNMTQLVEIPARFTPKLANGPLTHAAPLPVGGSASNALPDWPAGVAAADFLNFDLSQAAPAVTALTSLNPDGSTTNWSLAFPDMIGLPAEPVYVVEVDNALTGNLRFGDGVTGARPAAGAAFSAIYRVGTGTAGNIGAGQIARIVSNEMAITAISNPLPAAGGVDAETIEAVRRHAPAAFRVQKRAVTPQDYVTQSIQYPTVARAAATLRWTGSWYTHFIAVDRDNNADVDAAFKTGLSGALEGVRLAGHDLELIDPSYVALELDLTVCVGAFYFRAEVRQALFAILNNASGGLFDPAGFSFGQSVFLSPVIAAVQAVNGVTSVVVTAFQRYRQPSTDVSGSTGELMFAEGEIPRLDNDPNYPDRGVIRLTLQGGR